MIPQRKNMFNKILSILLILSLNSFAKKESFMSLGNTPKYQKNFAHFDYVNPKAKKGGTFKQAARGTYDSFNPFILKGLSASGIGMLYDTLMSHSSDESSVYYPLIAQEVEIDENNNWVKFYINPNARFSDNSKVRAEDVKFSFDILMQKGSPQYKRYYSDIKDVEVLDDLIVKFNFKTNTNKELPVILVSLNIMPKHFWKDKDFIKADNLVPLGSGPYLIDSYKFGKYIKYKRNKNYWAKDLNVNVGSYNFDSIQYDYYKDQSVTLEAFKAGEFDFRQEYTAKTWATMYKGKNFEKGLIKTENRKHENAQGMQAFGFNLRNPLFQNAQVRKALNLAFDFEWTNKQLFFSQYKRSQSFFDNSELKSTGLPSKEELLLLNPLKNQLPKSVFEEEFSSNKTQGSGKIRKELRAALKILKKEGWGFKNKILVKEGKEFTFEILLYQPNFERIVQPFIKNLKKIGIHVTLKVLDAVSYSNKVKNYDFDMMVISYPVSLSPGNELKYFWGSASADIIGSQNYMGIKNPAIDALIEKVIIAKNRKDLLTAVKALDRVMLNNHYVIPQWHSSSYRLAYWNKFNQPKISPKYGIGLMTWWLKDEYLDAK